MALHTTRLQLMIRNLLWVCALGLPTWGCSDTSSATGGGAVAADAEDLDSSSSWGDGAGSDGTGKSDGKPTGSDAATADAAIEDGSGAQDVSAVLDTQPVQDVDWSELLDPESDTTVASDAESTAPVGQLYAETATELYRLDLGAKKFELVGKFTFDKNPDDITDIAMDQLGALYACGHKDLYTCDVATAKCKWLIALGQEFNGLTFVPKGTVDPAVDALIGIAQSGDWTKITVSGGKVTLKVLGSYGGKWLSSGDAFSVEGIGTFATLKTATSTTDTLASIDPKTGKILQIIGDTGVAKLFGFAWWSGVFYGFSADGGVYTLDVATGKATPVKGIATPTGAKWWGAAVSTRAAGKVVK